MELLVTLAKIWRARMADVIRPVLACGSMLGASIRRTRRSP
jgi:hypothetical protein